MTTAHDAVVLISFGGPRIPEDVMPFLRNVVRGRGVPDERLAEVAEHYHHFDGASPIVEQTEQLHQALTAALAEAGHPMAVYQGNRNWTPYIADALEQAYNDGHESVLAVLTSPYASYSSCRQYLEDIDRALGERALAEKIRVAKVRQYFNHPGFVEPWGHGLIAAINSLRSENPSLSGEEIEVIFCAHSLPVSYQKSSGPDGSGGVYVAQHLDVAKLVIDETCEALGIELPNWQLAYQSRSGAPHIPWLEPDVNEVIEGLDASRKAVITVPLSFLSDHMEVIWDLDNEAATTAAARGFAFRRVATPGTDPTFVAGLVELIGEREGWIETRAKVGKFDAWFDYCPAGCCTPAHTGRPMPRVAGEQTSLGASPAAAGTPAPHPVPAAAQTANDVRGSAAASHDSHPAAKQA